MAGNLSEWTTEYSAINNGEYYWSCEVRGGDFESSNRYTAIRYYHGTATMSTDSLGFRAVLSCSPVS